MAEQLQQENTPITPSQSINFNPIESAPVIADNKYGQLSKEIVDMLVEYEHTYFREDLPVPFCGLKIYPVLVRDFERFSACTTCLTLNKNEDPKGIAMTHLDYLISKIKSNQQNEGILWSYKLQKLLELIFHIQNGFKCKKCGHVISYDSNEFTEYSSKMSKFIERIKSLQEQFLNSENLTEEDIQKEEKKLEEEGFSEAPHLNCPECGETEFLEMIKIAPSPKGKGNVLIVDGQTITNKDFTKLRQIVLYQNFYDYADDSWVDPEVKKDHDEKMRLEQMKNDVHATIEKKVVCLGIATGYQISDIYNMSIRRFNLALATVDDLINYKIMRQAVMSGFVSLPKGQKIEHWIYKPNKDMYGDSYKSTDEIHESVSNL